MLNGNGRNGKGIYLRLLTCVLGVGNIAAVSPQKPDTDKWAAPPLPVGARLLGRVQPPLPDSVLYHGQ